MKTVAVMQPYFAPYAGYFRLFAAADEVVMFDDVQFPRRGFVHRNRLVKLDGRLDWLTLPLNRAPVDTRIMDLTFRPRAADEMQRKLRAFRANTTNSSGSKLMRAAIAEMDERSPVDVIVRLLSAICAELSLPFSDLRSSALDVSDQLGPQDRIIAIAKQRHASVYLNPPGGRSLYQPEVFARSGLTLRFLEPYRGPNASICDRLNQDGAEAVRSEITSQSMPLVPA